MADKKKSGRQSIDVLYPEDWDSPDRRRTQGRRRSEGPRRAADRDTTERRRRPDDSRDADDRRRPAGSGGAEPRRRSAGSGGAEPRRRPDDSRGVNDRRKSADWDAAQDRRKSAGRREPESPGRAKARGKAQAGRGRDGGGDRKKKKHGFRNFLILLVLAAALLFLGFQTLVGSVYEKLNFKGIPSVAGLPMEQDGVINILLIGNDSRKNGDDGRSDAMILLSVSRRTKSIYMTSLLRDMYVDIPGYDGNRLNAAYSYGGAELLMKTIEQNFDIPVNRYVLVNFEAFANLVDAVGGVDLELTPKEVEFVNGYLVEYNMLFDRPQGTDNLDPSVSGLIHLNGPQALAYSRNRYIGTDFGRTERQRKVLTGVIGKLPKAVLTNFKGLTDGLLPNLTTNLTKEEFLRLSRMAGRLLTYEIASDSIPQPGTYKNVTIRKMEVLEVDFETNIRYLKNRLYGE